ncbi:hypothetical protein Tco_1458690 [Tanacetum coccineum]
MYKIANTNDASPPVTTTPLEATHADFFIEPKKVIQALTDPSRIEAMQDELLQFKLQKVWTLVDLARGPLELNGCTETRTMREELFQVTPKVSHLHAMKRIFRYLKGQPKLGLWYPKDSPFDLEAYTDSAYAGASLDRKSTTGGCQFLGSRLISWQCKKQTIVSNSTTEAEYVAAASCCRQVLWIQNQIIDYGYNFMNTKIFIDNESTICIVKNLVFHSKIKHNKIRHHFIRDSNKKKLIQMIKIYTNQNVIDLLTKAFDVSRLQYLIAKKPKESDGFEGIINFLNASSIRYVLTMNPIIYTSCIKQFSANAKAKTVNGEVQIQALEDGKKVIVTDTGVRRALQVKYAEGTECLPNATIFAEMKRIGAKTTAWNEFSSTMSSAIICLATNQKFNFSKYIFDKNLKGRVKFLLPQKKQPRRKQRNDTEVPQPNGSTKPITDEATNKEHVPIHSNNPLLNGEDRMKLTELLELCTNLSERVLDLENTKTSQAAEITKLKERVKKLERRNKLRIPGLKRLRKVGRSAQVVSFEDEGLGAQGDASKQGRKIADLDVDAEEVEVEKVVSTSEVTTASATTTTINELTLAQTLIEIKAAKPKAVTTTAATPTTTVTRPKARGVVVQEPNSFVPMDTEVVEGSKSQVEGKRKKLMEIVPDDEVAIDAIPLATKSPITVDWKTIKEGKMRYNTSPPLESYLSSSRP